MLRRLSVAVMGFMLVMIMLVGCSSGSAATGFERDQADPADALVESKCSLCHTTERVFSADKSAGEWDTTMARMKSNGMVITDDEYSRVLEYLSR